MSDDIRPGLLVLHGNRSESLAEAVFEWTRRHPLAPLEEEIVLVQSNGVAEWLKMALAAHGGVCAATRVELPARFLWRAYRQVLGRQAVPAQSALDKLPLTWRLMQILPGVALQAGYEPLAGFLRQGEMGRRLQLAERLADLYDQYQVYRADWLAAWAAGNDVLPSDGDPALGPPLPPDQRWQATLWRELLAPLGTAERAATRPQLQGRFLAAMAAGAAPQSPLARRVVLFGMTHVPMQTLQALAALSQSCQVLLAIPNPCRFHWADIIQGRDLLRMERRRHPLRAGRDLAAVALEDMHAHAPPPLLAAWGRLGRDFVRQLDAFDDAVAAQQRFALAKVDLFDEGPGVTLLQQVQARIRDLVPLAEHAALNQPIQHADRSIVFHIAHSAQREVEILHDQLLALLAHPPQGRQLAPRDIIVMVPDIELFAPAVRSVFGQYARGDMRHIPFDIADLRERGNNPLLVAVEWLMRLPQQRCRLSELRDLLDVPAVAARCGLQAADLPRLTQWLVGAGVRWGLDLAHRSDLGLGASGEQNTWLFGLRRMLLGYASGEGAPGAGMAFQGIEPYGEVGGLAAELAGSLASLLDALMSWRVLAATPATPAEWARRLRGLIDDFLAPTDDRERLTVAALRDALGGWLQACDTAAFAEPVALAVAREAWLAAVDEPGLGRRFRSGGVTFCTLLPMRAIPFEVVCLLGMNDGDYPRSARRNDFDLMGWPGQARPGDRSRRDDDRQLMLEALLSARRVLYLSWTGRSVRDNSEQPPSVLVSQLRDYLAAGWPGEGLAGRTTEHPLQPFSRRYFELPAQALAEAPKAPAATAAGLFTHAREWRLAHLPPAPRAAASAQPAFEPDARVPLTVAALARFLKNPVKDFFRSRLGVVFRDDDVPDDNEAFALDGLQEFGVLDEVIGQVLGDPSHTHLHTHLRARLVAQVSRIRRAGRLPVAAVGERYEQSLVETLLPMLERWQAVLAQYPDAATKEPLCFERGGLVLDASLDGLRAPADGEGGAAGRVWLELLPSRLCANVKQKSARADKLLAAWVRTLAASACGVLVRGLIVGRDASVTVAPLPSEQAAEALATLMQAWREGMSAPLPLASKTALALAAGASDLASVYEGGLYLRGEVQEPCLARMFPDFESLAADGRFADLAGRLYGPLWRWAGGQVTVEPHGAGS